VSGDLGIVVDSGSGFSGEEVSELGLGWIPLTINYPDGRSVPDTPDLDVRSLYDDIATGKLKTSQPTPDTMGNVFEEMLRKYPRLVYFAISSGLSGTYHTASMVARRFGGRVIVFDSLQMSVGVDVQVLEFLKVLPAVGEDVMPLLESLRARTRLYVLLETLDHLKASGRLGTVKFILGKALRMLPIISLDEEGRVYASHKVRGGIARAVGVMRKILEEGVSEAVGQVRLVTGRPMSQHVASLIRFATEELGCILKSVRPTAAVHTGLWGLGAAWVSRG
jgi:DegV family protein with EDD domain